MDNRYPHSKIPRLFVHNSNKIFLILINMKYIKQFFKTLDTNFRQPVTKGALFGIIIAYYIFTPGTNQLTVVFISLWLSALWLILKYN